MSTQPVTPQSQSGFSWSDEQAASSSSPATAKAQGSQPFSWSDEETSAPKGAGTPNAAAAPNAGLAPPAGPSREMNYANPLPTEKIPVVGAMIQPFAEAGENLVHDPKFRKETYEGAKTGAMAATAPLALETSIPRLIGAGVGSYVGAKGGQAIAKAAGGGEMSQEIAGDVGGLVGGGVGARRLGGGIERGIEPIADALREAPGARARIGSPELDATGENKPFAGGVDEPKPGKILDATGENQPFAGGLDEYTGPRTPRIAKLPGSAGSIAESVLKPPVTVAPASEVAPPSEVAPRIASSGDPWLDRLRANAARIEQEGHGNAFREEPESTPRTTNLNKDLTPALKASLREVNAAKARIAAPTSAAPRIANPEAGVPKTVYDRLIGDAMQEGPAWTPEKAQPVVDALNKNPGLEFEARGSVGEGRSTSNDLDLFQKKGSPADAANTLKGLGFKRVATTAHGETWTNGAQHIDIWDSEHEPVKGYSGALVTK